MRHELEHLIGREVQVTGHVSSRKTGHHGESRTCVSKCKVMLWDRFKTYPQNIRRKPDAKTDHLWAIFELDELAKKHPSFQKSRCRDLGLYKQGRFYGIVERYTRLNGTEDVGLRPVPCLTMNRQLIEMIHGLYESGSYEELIQTIDDIEGTGAIHFLAGWNTTAAENRATLFNFRRMAQRQLKVVSDLPTIGSSDVLPAPIPHVGSAVAGLQADTGHPCSRATGRQGKSLFLRLFQSFSRATTSNLPRPH